MLKRQAAAQASKQAKKREPTNRVQTINLLNSLFGSIAQHMKIIYIHNFYIPQQKRTRETQEKGAFGVLFFFRKIAKRNLYQRRQH